MINKLIAGILIPVFLSSSVLPAYSYSPITEFLGEIGVKFYQQGRYDDALHEFKKSLIVQPNYLPALEYIRVIEEIQGKKSTALPQLPPFDVGQSRESMPVAPVSLGSKEDILPVQLPGIKNLRVKKVIPPMVEVPKASLDALEEKKASVSAPVVSGIKEESSLKSIKEPLVLPGVKEIIPNADIAELKEGVSSSSKVAGEFNRKLKERELVFAPSLPSPKEEISPSAVSSKESLVVLAEKEKAPAQVAPEIEEKPEIPQAQKASPPASSEVVKKTPLLVMEKEATLVFKILPASVPESKIALPDKQSVQAEIVSHIEPALEEIVTPEFRKNLDVIEFEKEVVRDKAAPVKPDAIKPFVLAKSFKDYSAKDVFLNESLNNISQPINIEINAKARVVGKNISRFLVTQPGVVVIEQKSLDELLVIGKDVGYTYLHVWDDNGRWTLEWLGVLPKIEGAETDEETLRRQESARNFKLGYNLSWALSESGRGIGDLRRNGYSLGHGLSLNGPTPYGDMDASTGISRSKKSVDMTYLTMGLTNGTIGPFKKFSLRAFDFAPSISNLAFSGTALRGVMLKSPVFDNKLDYVAFWGRQGGGRYGNFSPTFNKIKNSFLDGFQLNYTPTTKQNYKFTLAHGWGRDRQQDLKNYAYDLAARWNFNKWNLGYEIANDTDKFAHLITTNFNRPKFRLTNELRSINRNFSGITGGASRQGELGALTTLYYNPSERLNITSSLDFYQTRLFPALDNDNRWNQDFNVSAAYKMAPKTWFNMGYLIRNDLGGISQTRFQSQSMGISHTFRLLKDISVYTNYQHQENKNFTSMASSYVNDRINSGVRFSLIGPLYYYLNKEVNWLEEKFTGVHSIPHALETGLDWSDQIGKSPFYGNFRFSYRDEEDATSSLSFLSGEDHIEGYSELSYKLKDTEIYINARFRNAWADNPSVNKRVDLSFNAGMRYLWDTGFSWNPVGSISGYVFTDINSDGLRQAGEPGIKNIKVWLNKVKFQLTDTLGYYEFKKIKAHKAKVAVEVKSIPVGHVLTVPMAQEVSIAQDAKVKVDFGIISRSEISGFIFEDNDGNGILGQGDKGIKGVNVILEGGQQVSTDYSGRYVFSNIVAGEHVISVDLNSVPVIYIPKVAIIKKIELAEGVAYNYNIPLRKIK